MLQDSGLPFQSGQLGSISNGPRWQNANECTDYQSNCQRPSVALWGCPSRFGNPSEAGRRQSLGVRQRGLGRPPWDTQLRHGARLDLADPLTCGPKKAPTSSRVRAAGETEASRKISCSRSSRPIRSLATSSGGGESGKRHRTARWRGRLRPVTDLVALSWPRGSDNESGSEACRSTSTIRSAATRLPPPAPRWWAGDRAAPRPVRSSAICLSRSAAFIGNRIVRLPSTMPRLMAWRIHQVACWRIAASSESDLLHGLDEPEVAVWDEVQQGANVSTPGVLGD